MKKSLQLLVSRAIIIAFAGLSLVFSPLASVHAASKDNVQGYIAIIILFINNTIIPVLFSIALLFFLINAARYFIINGANDEGREKAKTLALYGIGAFVFLLSIWGIVNMLVAGLGFNNNRALCPDYLGSWCSERAAERVGGFRDPYYDDVYCDDYYCY